MIIRIIFLTICLIIPSYSITIASSYETGMNFYEKKEFEDAVYYFRKSCDEEKDPGGCFWLAMCFRHGEGVQQNINKTLTILQDLYDKYKFDNVLYFIAHTIEHFTYNLSNYSRAYEIYKQLSTSSDNWVSDKSKISLNRFYIMNAVNELFSSKFDYSKKLIDIDTFKSRVKYINIEKTPHDFNVVFSELSTRILQEAEISDGIIMDSLILVGQSFLKGLAGDITFIGDAIGHGYKAYNLSSNLEEAYKKFYEILNKYKISTAWWKVLNEQYSTK